MTPGQAAYEADCNRYPYYDGSHRTRRRWDDLADYEQATWERNPTPRGYGRAQQ